MGAKPLPFLPEPVWRNLNIILARILPPELSAVPSLIQHWVPRPFEELLAVLLCGLWIKARKDGVKLHHSTHPESSVGLNLTPLSGVWEIDGTLFWSEVFGTSAGIMSNLLKTDSKTKFQLFLFLKQPFYFDLFSVFLDAHYQTVLAFCSVRINYRMPLNSLGWPDPHHGLLWLTDDFGVGVPSL